jgi:hypothetical protein
MMATEVLVRPVGADHGQPEGPLTADTGGGRVLWQELALAAAGFAALCIVVLTHATQLLEPDDYAYQASIVALSHGHVLLTTAQYHALARQLGDGSSIPQWVHLSNGYWISQKNPGYPFAVVVFQLLGILRLAPLFYAAVASAALFIGGRRWLGRYGGAAAVLLFCTSGAAITFAWRPTMESFTDAALVATGAGLLLWTMLATDAPKRRRLLVGLAGFGALEAATAIRYTDVVELAIAVVAVILLARRSNLSWRTVSWWLGSVAVLAGAILSFDAAVYGAPLKTGYQSGLITFSLSALGPNLAHMPGRLVVAMPMVVLAVVAVLWIAGRALRDVVRRRPTVAGRHRDVVICSVLLAGWAAIWGLYLTYTWTVNQFRADPVHVVRFYLPALGLIALLGAWLLVRIPAVLALGAVVALVVFGVLSFHAMAVAGGPPGFGPGFPGRGGFGPGGVGPGGPRPGRGGPPLPQGRPPAGGP